MLWGVKIAPKELIKKANENMKGNVVKPVEEVKQTPAKEAKPEVLKVKPPHLLEFDVNANYGIEDLDFLNKEYDRIEGLFNTIEDFDEIEELEDIQDKLANLIEGLEQMKKVSGQGFKKGSEEAKEHMRKVREAKQAKKGVYATKNEVKQTSKARVEKGTEEAKEIGKRLAEARKKKKEMTIKEQPIEQEKPTITKLKGRPFYYAEKLPKGYHYATEEEAIQHKKVGEIGKYEVDHVRYKLYTMYGLLLTDNIDTKALYWVIMGLKRRIMKLLEKVEIYEIKKSSDKHKDKRDEITNKYEELEDERKNLQAGWNWLYKLYCSRTGIKYVKQKFVLPSKKEIIQSKLDQNQSKTIYEQIKEELHEKPITPKDVRLDVRLDVKSDGKKNVYLFENNNQIYEIPVKAFGKDGMLLAKHAKKLYENNIILHPKFYSDSDYYKYFYVEKEPIEGSGPKRVPFGSINWYIF